MTHDKQHTLDDELTSESHQPFSPEQVSQYQAYMQLYMQQQAYPQKQQQQHAFSMPMFPQSVYSQRQPSYTTQPIVHESCPIQPTLPEESNDEVKIVGARSGSYTKEDLLLISAWLNTGQDPIDGTGKKFSTFWERIWRYYAQVVNRDPSGTTDADKVELAHKMYKRIEKKKFKLDHCWEQLKHHKKWELEVEKKKGKPKKKEKEIRKRKRKDTESGSKFAEIRQGFIDEKKKDWDRHFLSEQFKEDERIMLTNTDGMDEMTNEFYKTKKEEILARNSWTKPPPGYHTINTNGSLSEVGGFGAIVKTEEGMSVKAVAGRVRA
ncbi:hypothetical protein GIB67_014603 [Kingdonia uniflora]|uniref:No apical meristem-associated C-terminal domain-containing protein n=1 Tax=Kingdonia uniflora TaxID=39325 RepID=A0A7J7MP61_9MAGN|nr:hypothetical protein GIB67_014603 [Kingdonia uniflora]